MKKWYLFCSSGMSTSLLAKRMQDYCNDNNIEVEIEAFSIADVGSYVDKIDVCVLGPQVKYHYDKVKGMYGDKPVVVLPMNIYGTMNGELAVKVVMEAK